MALKWRKATWPSKTYHAKTADLSYTVDHNGHRWTVRGWKEGAFVLYEGGPTMRSMREAAQAHADANS